MNVQGSGDETPSEPDWAKLYDERADREFAERQWAEICRELSNADTLSVGNGHAIARLVHMRVLYERAHEELRKRGGPIVAAPGTGVPMHNPALSIMRGLDETIRQLESELCISPLRRRRAGKVVRQVKRARAADAYLKPVGNVTSIRSGKKQ